jgi:TusA-related sulfurtransferase
LPREGELLGTHYLFCFYVKDNESKMAEIMIDNALQSLPEGEVLLAGVDQNDPSNQVLMQYKGRREFGKHYLVSYQETVKVEGVNKFEVARI